MTTTELFLNFSGNNKVTVSFNGTDSGSLDFTNPVTQKDRSDIQWYIETYGTASLAEPDDQEAKRIEARLPEIGKALFDAVFDERAAQRLFDRFQDFEAQQRILTINSSDASILSLPWELLHDPTGVYLFREKPHISVRRKMSGATGGRQPFKVNSKDRLHLLFVVSRPKDAGFIDPRTDPRAVMDGLEKHAPGRVSCEFLRPATLNALAERLDDDSKPAIDILHFDGHGVFRQVSEKEAEDNPSLYGKSIHSEIQRERQTRKVDNNDTPVGIGFLLFEKEDQSQQLISAEDLWENLFNAKIGLVVLSACQTAALNDNSDPMASVAGRLTATGIPSILAMTHSVLVATTEMLFGSFYQSLARGRTIGRSLDDARTWLANNPEKYEVRRGSNRRMLELHDWFLPALFHGGIDSPLLTTQEDNSTSAVPQNTTNLRPPHEAGFFGRRRELWDIERWFATNTTRRISITGFGGQGKTELALEAGRWLTRTNMFERAVFVDYSQVQSEDAASVAVSAIATVLEESLPDVASTTRALGATPCLIILDNLETVSEDGLRELLDAARDWSEAGGSRVLLTSRRPDFNHPQYRIQGTRVHRRISLQGLGSAAYPDDALDWFVKLDNLPSADDSIRVPPPKRDELIELFDRVGFHPLSIAVLAQQLRTRTAKRLGERLQQLLSEEAESMVAEQGTPASLIASLHLSLEQLNDRERQAVQRLGVFQGGAFEDDLLAITGLGQSDQDDEQRKQLQTLLDVLEGDDPRLLLKLMGKEIPDGVEIPADLLTQIKEDPGFKEKVQQLRAQLAQMDGAQEVPSAENIWPGLWSRLEAAALIEAETVAGVNPPFLRFHPTLAPMLWAGLDAGEQDQLILAHRKRYYALANHLYHEDKKNPHQVRAIVRRELPNLLFAVGQSLDSGDKDAVDFADSVNRFLTVFGMSREAALLTQRAEKSAGEKGSETWYLAQSNRGEQLLASGQVEEAAALFSTILQTLGQESSYKLAVTLGRLGRCYQAGGRPDLAEIQHHKGIAVTEQLEQNEQVKRHRNTLHTELADVLTDQGKFAEAREQYENGLEIAKKVNDPQQGVILGQLGTLAMLEGDRAKAVKRHQQALELFQRLNEPGMEAVAHHQLGMVFQKAKQWQQAEHHYRQSASLKEQQGNLAGAAKTWNQLAYLSFQSGKVEAAETWYRKAIEGGRQTGDTANVAAMLNNLADLLQNQTNRLTEARQLAEEALTIKKTLDASAAAIWTTYTILAEIADQEKKPDQAVQYRGLAREAKRNYAGTAHEMKRFAPVIAKVVGAVAGDEQAIAAANQLVEQGQQASGEGSDFAKSIKRILAGERDAEELCYSLSQLAPIIETILQAIKDPATLAPLLPEDDDPQ